MSDGTFFALTSLVSGVIQSLDENWNKDAELVRQFKNGDRDAYGRLYEKYHEKIYSYCFYLLSRVDEAEEDAKDTMKNAFEKCHADIYSLKEEGKFFWWLRKTAYYICMDIYKERKKYERIDIENKDEDDARIPFQGIKIENIVAPVKNPEDAIIEKEIEQVRRKILIEALNALNEKYRMAVVLRHYMEYSHREAAELMGCKEADIKKWIYRGLEKMRKVLEPYLGLIG